MVICRPRATSCKILLKNLILKNVFILNFEICPERILQLCFQNAGLFSVIY